MMLAKPRERLDHKKMRATDSKQENTGWTSLTILFGLIATGLRSVLLPAAYCYCIDPGGGDWPMWAARPIAT